MENKKFQLIICFVCILVLNVRTQSFSQNSMFFEAGKMYAQNNMYLSNGLSFDVGYQHDLKRNIVWRTSINISSLNQNPDYLYSDEPSINLKMSPFMNPGSDILQILPKGIEMLVVNSNINTNVGMVFRQKSRVQPAIFTGISANFTYQRFTDFIVENSEFHVITGDLIESNQFNIGLQASAGLLIKISEKIKLQTFANYIAMPFVKIGIQKEELMIFETNIGLIYQF